MVSDLPGNTLLDLLLTISAQHSTRHRSVQLRLSHHLVIRDHRTAVALYVGPRSLPLSSRLLSSVQPFVRSKCHVSWVGLQFVDFWFADAALQSLSCASS